MRLNYFLKKTIVSLMALTLVAGSVTGCQKMKLNSKNEKITSPINGQSKGKKDGENIQVADGADGVVSGENGAGAGTDGAGADGAGAGADAGASAGDFVKEANPNAGIGTNLEDVKEFNPHCIAQTKPSKMIDYTNITVNTKPVKNAVYEAKANKKSADKKITMGMPQLYTGVNGVITFRGNNFRNNPTFGYQNFENNKLKTAWSKTTGSLVSEGRAWTGSGWTGQPLIVKWPKSTKKIMNMYDWAKEDDNLVEVIYACLDGKIYFLDLATGKATRDVLNIGFTFKGAGALDPRGYPIMYVGSGYNSSKGISRAFIISLVDGKILHEFGAQDPFSLRGRLSFFDSSALVDAETDTLIYPGENGILYLIHLNTKYNEATGKLKVKPDKVTRWRYHGKRTTTYKYWPGMEVSASVYKGYIYLADNGGHLMCLDLNTLKLVWVQDVLDDTNSSPVLDVEDGKLYLYISPSFHLGWRKTGTAEVPIWKIDAETGKKIWHKSYECSSVEGVSGGVQSTIASGANELKDYIYCTVSRTGGQGRGVLTCINKKTGKVAWEYPGSYAWSSPLCIYDKTGAGRVMYCGSDGNLFMLNGVSGELLTKLKVSDGNIEASPAVYEDTLVVGTRSCRIQGVRIK